MKKMAAVVSSALLIALLLEGCNSSSNNSASPSASSGSASASSPAEGAAGNYKDPSVKKTLTWYLDASWMPAEFGTDWVTEEIEKETGFDVNLIIPAANDNGSKLQQMIASNQLPDIITIGSSNPNIPQLISNKMVAPLNELADQYATDFYKYADPDVLIWNKQEDGNVYGYTDYTSSPKDIENDPVLYPNDTLMVRKDIYEAIGKPDMSTQAGFEAALKAAQQYMPSTDAGPLIPFGVEAFTAANDPNGSVGLGYVLADFLAVPYVDADGKIYDRFTDPTYVSWLKAFSHMSQEGLIPADVVANTTDQIASNIENGRYFAWMGQAVDFQTPIQSWYSKDASKAYIAVMGPQNDNHDDPIMPVGSPSGWLESFVGANADNKENAINFMTYMISPESIILQNLGIEGKSYTVDSSGKYQLTSTYSDMLKNDPDNVYTITGIANWAFFQQSRDVDATTYAFSASMPSFDLVRSMYKEYAFYNGQMTISSFSGDSPEGKAQQQIYTLWDTTLPKLLLAKSDSEFDSTLASFKSKRDSIGYSTLIEAEQQQVTANIEKIKQFPDSPYK